MYLAIVRHQTTTCEVPSRHSGHSYRYSFVSVGQITVLPVLNWKSRSFQVLTPLRNCAISGKLCTILKTTWGNNDGLQNRIYLLTLKKKGEGEEGEEEKNIEEEGKEEKD